MRAVKLGCSAARGWLASLRGRLASLQQDELRHAVLGGRFTRRVAIHPVLQVGAVASWGHFYARCTGLDTLTAEAKDVRLWHGIRISSPERVWCELASTLDLPDLVAAGDYLIQHRLPSTNPDKLTDAVARFPGRRGIRALQSALPLLHDRSESRQESRLRVIIMLAGFAGLEVNYPVTTSGGYNYRGDLAFPEYKVFIEYQSELHRSPEAFQRDMTRISRLEADGWYVMQVNIRDLDDPAELVQRIRRLLALRPHIPEFGH